MARKAFVAGQFYEARSDKLESQIKDCFTSENGPGELPITKRRSLVSAIIAPHAGYTFSGPCAAWAYKELAEAPFADAYIVLGTNHSGLGPSCTSLENYETPFGIVRTEQTFAKMLMEKCGLVEDASAHAVEHSIEVQLPFLQFVNMEFLNELKIVPILVSGDSDFKKLGLDIKEAALDYGKKVFIIASSDFTHYGRNYHYVPFSSEVQKQLYELDSKAIDFIKGFDADGLLRYLRETGATVCGSAPIATLLASLRAKKAKLLQYYTSGDIVGDYKNAVGYAAMSFE